MAAIISHSNERETLWTEYGFEQQKVDMVCFSPVRLGV